MTTQSLLTLAINKIPALANHFWQSTIFAAAVLLLTLLLRRNQAQIRYSLWLAASLKFLLPFSLLISLGGFLPSTKQIAAPPSVALYSALDVVAQPFSDVPIHSSTSHTATLRERLSIALPAALVVWFLGTASVLLIWIVRWRQLATTLRQAIPISQGREIDILRNIERRINTRQRITILQSPTLMEPGIFGILHPTLIWPARLSSQLEDCHIRAILTHELVHVQRHDNLTAALHMLVEAIFWFHPLVWWIERHMIKERERACDEAVVQLGGTPATYAEGLLKVCRFCIESPLPCVAGIAGADLNRRILSVMSSLTPLKLTLVQKLALATISIAAVAAPLVSGQAIAIFHATTLAPTAYAIVPPAPISKPEIGVLPGPTTNNPIQLPILPVTPPQPAAFDIATIKPSGTIEHGMGLGRSTPDGISLINTTVKSIIANAYGIRQDLISGGASWTGSAEYDIEAKVLPTQAIPTPHLQQREIKLLLQSLLVDRFKLILHLETKELPIYNLTIAKGGTKLHEAKPGDTYPNGVRGPDGTSRAGMMMIMNGKFTGQAIPISGLVNTLELELHRTVIDNTGLTGKYDIYLQLPPQFSNDTDGPSIFVLLEEQLGLKLDSTKGPVKTLIIDHIERPTEN